MDRKKGKALFALAVASMLVVLSLLAYVYSTGGQEAYTGGGDDGTGDAEPPDTVDLAPDFSYYGVSGGIVSLSANRGKVVVIDFMATWCQPCKDQITNLRAIHEDYASRGVVIISLNVDQQVTDSELLTYRNEQGAQWAFATDTKGVSLEPEYYATSIPTIVIVNKEGAIAKRDVGLMSVAALESAIDPLL